MIASSKEKIILGIDPGSNVMGFGLVKIIGSKIELIQFGSLNFSKEKDHYIKLKKIHSGISEIIKEYMPDELAIEAPFFGKNVQSMLKLGRAQGVCITAALERDIPIFEYAPKRIKQSITGSGNSSKEQVAKMIVNVLNIKQEITNLDATDALGAALCHYYSKGKVSGSNGKNSNSKKGNWDQFIKNNPDRLKS